MDDEVRRILSTDDNELVGSLPVGEQAPPVHEPPPVSPQPMQEIVKQLDRALTDIGGLVSRTDQIETTMRRVDRQVIMLAGCLALVLWTVKQFAGKLDELQVEHGA